MIVDVQDRLMWSETELLQFESNATSIEKLSSGRFRVEFAEGNQMETDLVLYATGREPAVKDIGIENVDLELRSDSSIIVDENFRTSVDNIFALGDVIGGMQLTPVAIEEAMCFASTHFLNIKKTMDYDNVATAVFCQPNIGTVGLTEDEASEAGYAIDIYRSTFRPMKHTLSGSDEKFMMKLVVDRRTDKMLGVHMVGSEAGEVIQGIAIAMKVGVTKEQFDATVGIHPTTAEEFVTMREAINR